MNIIMVRSLKGYPDSRVEKELYSLSKEYNVSLFGWNRYSNIDDITSQKVEVFGKEITYYHYNQIAPIGLGFKKLLFPLLKYWNAEYKFLKKHIDSFDIIHACDFDTVLPALYIAKKYHKKIVYDIFDYYADSHSAPSVVKKIIKSIENYVIGKCNATIICSEKRREQICDSRPKMLEIVHNTPIRINTSESGNFVMYGDAVNLVYVGLLSEDRYLREISNVVNKRTDVVWHIGGWGPLNSFFEELAGKSKNIKYYGELSYINALELESKCDIMTALYDPLVPNHRYAAPNKFYEAIMLGKPLIMIKNTGMDEYLIDNELGEVINLEENDFEKKFDVALSNLLKRRNDWDKIKSKAQDLYNSEFSWEQMETRLLNLYRKI